VFAAKCCCCCCCCWRQVLFDAEEALLELRRLGLLQERCVSPGTSDTSDDTMAAAAGSEQGQQQGSAGRWLQAAGAASRPASPAEMLSTVIERLWSSSNGRAKGLAGISGNSSRPSSRPRAVAGKVRPAQGTTNGGGSTSSGDRRGTAPGSGPKLATTPSSRTSRSSSSTEGSAIGTASTGSSSGSSGSSISSRDEVIPLAGLSMDGSEVQYAVVGPGDARQVLQVHWADLLDRRVDSIVAGLGAPPAQAGVRHGPLASSGSRRDK
jgi:hypothetical protein